MALTWDTINIANSEEVCFLIAPEDHPTTGVKAGDRILNPVTSALIWHSLNTGIGTIREENAGEVWARIKLVETLYGSSLRNSEGDRPITKDDIVAHVGLKTNASFRDESRTTFLKRQATSFLNDEVTGYARHLSVLQDAAALEAGKR